MAIFHAPIQGYEQNKFSLWTVVRYANIVGMFIGFANFFFRLASKLPVRRMIVT